MQKERGLDRKPLPEDLQKYLNTAQAKTLEEIKGRGWSLWFIRRPFFQAPTIVLKGPNEQSYGVLLENGSIDFHSELGIRNRFKAEDELWSHMQSKGFLIL